MTVFRVWAPNAADVAVDVGGDRVPMEGGDEGWFEADVDWAGPGSEYRFVLDGGEPLPDPRSPSQPYGVDGPSQVVDHGAFQWSDDGWKGVHLPAQFRVAPACLAQVLPPLLGRGHFGGGGKDGL